MTVLEWMNKWESIWLFLVLMPEMLIGFYSAYWIKREFDYDAQKDIEKKQRKTRTTKKTTSTKDGGSVVEESTEISEPVQEVK